MKTLSFEQMETVVGGNEVLTTSAGAVCGAAISGSLFGGFGLFVTAAIFGPSCIGLVTAAILSK